MRHPPTSTSAVLASTYVPVRECPPAITGTPRPITRTADTRTRLITRFIDHLKSETQSMFATATLTLADVRPDRSRSESLNTSMRPRHRDRKISLHPDSATHPCTSLYDECSGNVRRF